MPLCGDRSTSAHGPKPSEHPPELQTDTHRQPTSDSRLGVPLLFMGAPCGVETRGLNLLSAWPGCFWASFLKCCLALAVLSFGVLPLACRASPWLN